MQSPESFLRALDRKPRATSYGGTSVRNDARFYYDGYRKLIREEQSPFATWAPRTVQYVWGPAGGGNGTRLEQIIYPSGTKVGYSYGTETDESPAHHIQRMTAVGLANTSGVISRPLAAYDYTGGGKKTVQTWGDPNQQLLRAQFAGGPTPGLDRFGRLVRLRVEHPGGLYSDGVLHDYRYHYDPNGNRLAARVRQVSFPGGPSRSNQESYLCDYDPLNRLVYAAFGQLNGVLDGLNPQVTPNRTSRWGLDLLGNWSTVERFTDLDFDGRADGTESFADAHNTNPRNQIRSGTIGWNWFANGAFQPPSPVDLLYDPAGSLAELYRHIDSNNPSYTVGQRFTYDAWNRIVQADRLENGSSKDIAEYQYDALGRRIRKKVGCTPGLNTPPAGERYHYAGSRLIERFGVEDYTGTGPWPCGGGGGGGGQFKLIADTSEPSRDRKEAVASIDNRQSTLDSSLDDHPELDPAFEAGGFDDPKLLVQAAGPQIPKTLQEYIHGLDYIDEHVAVQDDEGMTQLVIQDANYNVVALVDFLGYGLTWQSHLTPYGHFHYHEDAQGNNINLTVNPEGTTTPIKYPFWFQGKWFDQEIGGYHFDNRLYLLGIARFAQMDPNGQALALLQAGLMNGSAPMVQASFDMLGQQIDGPNPYEPFRSNPITNSDPSGLFTSTDTLITAGLVGGLYGLADDYAHYGDEGSKWHLGFAFARGAGFGTGAAAGFGWLTGALASYAGISAGTAATALGLMFAPPAAGYAAYEMATAETMADQIMAQIDLGFSVVGVIAPHVALWRGANVGTVGALEKAAARALRGVGPGKGGVHGTHVHTEFKKQVQALGKGLNTEVSYKGGFKVAYGTPGSIRVDVVEGPVDRPLAIYDLKTGSSRLTARRIEQIRSHLPDKYKDIPIVEIRGEGQ